MFATPPPALCDPVVATHSLPALLLSAPPSLLADLLWRAEARDAAAPALVAGDASLNYGQLAALVRHAAAGLLRHGLQPSDRVAVWLDKRIEMVAGCFAATAAGGAFVPLNPLLKPAQALHILHDCGAAVLLTSPERAALLQPHRDALPGLRLLVLTGDASGAPASSGCASLPWAALCDVPAVAARMVTRPPRIDADIAAIFYTSGSTGRPKGVVLSHRNLVVGATSVASYLGNAPGDTLLAVLPLSFDAGFSQLTTAFHAGARVVLLNYLLPRDVHKAIHAHRVTCLTAVPPLFMQLLQTPAADYSGATLRYFANTGGRMPRDTLQALRQRWPQAQPFLMYGLTEAFRSTYLRPEDVDRKPDSIGRAIPNAQVLVLRDDGTECAVDEPGELVHRGPLVAQGYWGDAQTTAARFKPLPAGVAARPAGLPMPEIAVFSGDTVRRDSDGDLYFVGRRDEMIKTSGYRVSPTEVEEVLYATRLVGECAVFATEHAVLGQAIHAVATAPDGSAALDVAALLAACKRQMPAYMVPMGVAPVAGPLPRNPNGKIDRKQLATEWAGRAGRAGRADGADSAGSAGSAQAATP